MKRSYIGLALGTLVAVGAVLGLPSCGHDQKLVSLAVTPASPGFTFPVPTAGATGQYKAYGSYIHPPATKDVTSQAIWAVNDQVVSINAGLVTTNGSCGSADGSATMPAGNGVGTGTSQPGGISCPGTTCGAQFPTRDLVTLTAAPGPNSSFGLWTGCTAGSIPNQCPVTIVGGGIVSVTATFNSP